MAVYQALLLNTVVPQIQAAQAGDSYVMVVNATTPALRITQTGTGNALEVEDSANPDSTPFVVSAAGDVGIGLSSPAQKLDVYGNGMKVNNASYVGYLGADSVFGSSGVASSLTVRSDNALTFSTGGPYTRATIDTSGNLGLGVTPTTRLDIAMPAGAGTPRARVDQLSDNPYYELQRWSGTGSDFLGIRIRNLNGALAFDQSNAAAIGSQTFTQAMTLDASGNLYLGVTSAAAGRLAIKDVSGSGNNVWLIGRSSDGTSSVSFRNNADTAYNARIECFDTGVMTFGTGTSATERARITSGGNLNFGNSSADRATTAGTAVINIFNGTAPVGTLANGISLYSSSGEAYVMDAAGNATLFSPHDSETNEWIFKSKHTPSGKVLKIDVEKMLRFINDHFGLDAIHEFTEE